MAPAPGGPGRVRGRAAAGVFMVPRSPRPGRYIHACFRTRGARAGRAAALRAAAGSYGRVGRHRHRQQAAAGARCPRHGVGSAVPVAPCPVPGARRRGIRARRPAPDAGARRCGRRTQCPCSVPAARCRYSVAGARLPGAPRGGGGAGLGSARRVRSAQHPGASSSPFPLIGAARRVPMGRSRRAGPPRVLALTMGSGGAAAPLMGRPERRRRACPSRPGLALRVAAPRAQSAAGGARLQPPTPPCPAPPPRTHALPAPAGRGRHGRDSSRRTEEQVPE